MDAINDLDLFRMNPRAYREAKQITPQQAAEAMRRFLQEDHRHPTSVTKMEKVGSYNTRAIKAYAHVMQIDDILAAIDTFEKIADKNKIRKKV